MDLANSVSPAHHATKTAKDRDVVVIDISADRVMLDIREPTARRLEIDSFGTSDYKTRPKHFETYDRHEGGRSSIEEFFPPYLNEGAKGRPSC